MEYSILNCKTRRGVSSLRGFRVWRHENFRIFKALKIRTLNDDTLSKEFRNFKYTIFLIGFLLIAPVRAYAAEPSVFSFIAGSYSLRSGQSASFAWSVGNAGGYSFVIPCTVGIKFKKTDGSVFLCDTPINSIATSIDGIDLSVWNLSGAIKSFTARVIPKDATGADFSLGRQDIQVSVAPVAEPIESMSGTATSTPSGTPYMLSWSGGFIDGVNLSISCALSIRTTSTSYPAGDLPCNTYLFVNGLSASGSIPLSFSNNDPFAQNITLTLTPMMAPGIYNGIQTKSITVSVESNIIPDPVTTAFNISTTTDRVLDGNPISFSWTTEKSAGANLRISCNGNISVLFTVGSATSTPKCDMPAFDPRISASGTGTVVFTNKSATSERITIMLVPERKTGGFDATRGKDISFWIIPKIISASATTVTSASITIPTVVQPTIQIPAQTTTSPSETQASSVQAKKIFTKPLARGSFGTEVRSLQEILKEDSVIYPEGIVNGNFGPATLRAVKRLQEKYGLATTGVPGYGNVGPKTRALLNSLVGGKE